MLDGECDAYFQTKSEPLDLAQQSGVFVHSPRDAFAAFLDML